LPKRQKKGDLEFRDVPGTPECSCNPQTIRLRPSENTENILTFACSTGCAAVRASHDVDLDASSRSFCGSCAEIRAVIEEEHSERINLYRLYRLWVHTPSPPAARAPANPEFGD
jgi:hypothetical protein